MSVSPYVRLLKPPPGQWRRPGAMGPIKRLVVWHALWREHHNQWATDVIVWLAEQRCALLESSHVGPHALSKRDGA